MNRRNFLKALGLSPLIGLLGLKETKLKYGKPKGRKLAFRRKSRTVPYKEGEIPVYENVYLKRKV